MAKACHVAVRMATGDVFSDAEIDAFLDRVARQAIRKRQAAPTLDERAAIAEAAGAVTKEALKEALIARRTRIYSQISKEGREAWKAALPAKMTPAEKINQMNTGNERLGYGTGVSTDAVGRAEQMALLGQVDTGLKQMPGLKERISNFFGLGENGFHRLIAREMARLNGDGSIEPTGDEGALHAARVFVKALEDVRELQNTAGAWIGKVAGYIGRQSHDPARIAGPFFRELAAVGELVRKNGLKGFDWGAAVDRAEARAFQTWHDFIRPKLHERTWEGLDHSDIPTDSVRSASAERAKAGSGWAEGAKDLAAKGIIRDPTDLVELMLHSVWLDIVTGRHEELAGQSDADFRPKPSLARAVSRERVLHFKSPDDWIDYAEKYGKGGSLYGGVIGQIERGARNAALMRRWGPAPEAAFDAEVRNAAAETRSAKERRQLMSGGGVNPGLRAHFEAVAGIDAPQNLRLAAVMRSLRNWEAATKLGAMVLSKTTDLPITAAQFKRVGGTWLEGYRAATVDGIAHLRTPEAQAAADALDTGARAFAGHLANSFHASDGPAGWSAWAAQMTYRAGGFEWANESVRQGAAIGWARLMAREAEKGWDGLNIGTRETLERFAISPEEWERARQGLEQSADGRTYFTLDHLDGDRDLQLKFRTYVHDFLDNVVSEPRARERAFASAGLKAGTMWGEFARSFWQFKGFMNTIVGRHLVPAWHGYAGVKPVFLLGHLILGTTLAGFLSLEMKALTKGELAPGLPGGQPIAPWRTWLSALAQGGGLGMYGDFLWGDINRNNWEWSLAQMGGPMLSDAENVGTLMLHLLHGGDANETTGKSPVPGEAVNLLKTNLPIVNTWYTRLAIDYLLLWRLQEAVSPGYLHRYVQTAEHQRHAAFWLPPTAAAQGQ